MELRITQSLSLLTNLQKWYTRNRFSQLWMPNNLPTYWLRQLLSIMAYQTLLLPIKDPYSPSSSGYPFATILMPSINSVLSFIHKQTDKSNGKIVLWKLTNERTINLSRMTRCNSFPWQSLHTTTCGKQALGWPFLGHCLAITYKCLMKIIETCNRNLKWKIKLRLHYVTWWKS